MLECLLLALSDIPHRMGDFRFWGLYGRFRRRPRIAIAGMALWLISSP